MTTGQIVEQLIRLKDRLSDRQDRDLINTTVNHLYDIDRAVLQLKTKVLE